jgi:hypothetical protein
MAPTKILYTSLLLLWSHHTSHFWHHPSASPAKAVGQHLFVDIIPKQAIADGKKSGMIGARVSINVTAALLLCSAHQEASELWR